MNVVIDVFDNNGNLLETYVGCNAYFNFTQKFVKLEILGIWHDTIDFTKIECDNANSHYKIYKK